MQYGASHPSAISSSSWSSIPIIAARRLRRRTAGGQSGADDAGAGPHAIEPRPRSQSRQPVLTRARGVRHNVRRRHRSRRGYSARVGWLSSTQAFRPTVAARLAPEAAKWVSEGVAALLPRTRRAASAWRWKRPLAASRTHPPDEFVRRILHRRASDLLRRTANARFIGEAPPEDARLADLLRCVHFSDAGREDLSSTDGIGRGDL